MISWVVIWCVLDFSTHLTSFAQHVTNSWAPTPNNTTLTDFLQIHLQMKDFCTASWIAPHCSQLGKNIDKMQNYVWERVYVQASASYLRTSCTTALLEALLLLWVLFACWQTDYPFVIGKEKIAHFTRRYHILGKFHVGATSWVCKTKHKT